MLEDRGVFLPHSDEDKGVELFYAPSESIFAAVASEMVALGWSIFPQSSEGRYPGRVFEDSIKWSEEHDLKNRLPTEAALKLWKAHCATLNVACVFGPASSHAFAVDIDVMDATTSAQIVALADEILGYTPLRREGRAPKLALIYRHSEEDAPRVPSISRYFAEQSADGNAVKSENGIEIQGAGKLLTFHGKHHRTGRYFKWLNDSPMMVGPMAAPLVSADRVKAFIEAVDARFRFHRGSSFTTGASLNYDDDAKLNVPRLKLAGGGVPWTEEDGIVVNGREEYLRELVFRTVTGNQEALFAARDKGVAELKQFCVNVAHTVVENYEATATAKWKDLKKEVLERVTRLVRKLADGRMDPVRVRTTPSSGQQFTAPLRPEGDGDPELAFLPPNRPGARALLEGMVEPPPEGAKSLAIEDDRSAIAARIQDGLGRAFDSFFDGVYEPAGRKRSGRDGPRVDILKAPPGAGKTSRCIRYIAADPRTYRNFTWIDPKSGKERTGRAPIVMLLPTYDTIDELRHRARNLNLDGSLSDDELRAAARDMGLLTGPEAEARMDELRRDALNCVGISQEAGGDARGLVTMTYSGRIKAGCLVADKVRPAMDAGIGTAAFCKATVSEGKGKDRVYVEKVCPHHDVCPAMAQRAAIGQAHVVFMPHSFLALALPDEIVQARAIIADERIHHLFLHMATFPAASLNITRRSPRVSVAEKAKGETPEGMQADRDRAASIVLSAMAQGRDPARALLKHSSPGEKSDVGVKLAQSAFRVCGSAILRDGALSPETTVEEVRAMCSLPTGKDVREELEFWKIVRDRMTRLRRDEMRASAIVDARARLEAFPVDGDDGARVALADRVRTFEAMPLHANGDTDARIQYLTEDSTNGAETEIVRVSWRTEPNWPGTPTLLLDASASPEITAKVWGVPLDRIAVHDVVEDGGLAQNVKIVGIVNGTFSNVSLAAAPSANLKERVDAGKRLAKVRSVLSSVSALFGDGRVVAGTSIKLRKVINEGWNCPSNVDWCHFGAMRGLDMFKAHSAAVSIGRMEVPVRSVDGLVAALTFDDLDPEKPFDLRGDGRGSDDRPLRVPQGPQRLRMRTGHVVTLPVPMLPGRWARLIQRQYREEELLQFCGRLRPVYREGRTPVWFALSSIIPEELIVDDLIHIDDLLGRNNVEIRTVVGGSVTADANANARIVRDQSAVARLWETARETGGVIDGELISKATVGGNFRSEAGVQRAMELAGFDPVGGVVTHRRGRGHAVFRWRPVGGGEPRHAFVRSSLPDPEAALKGALLEHLGIEAEIKEISRPDKTFGRVRAPDKVDLAMGDAAARSVRERSRMDRLGEMALADGHVEFVGEAMTYAIEALGGSETMALEVLDAVMSIHDHWVANGSVADDRLMPIVCDVPLELNEEGDYENYDSMGASVADADADMEMAA